MNQSVAQFFSSKTNWTLISGAIGLVGGVVTHTVDPVTAIQSAIGLLSGFFMRDTLASIQNNTAPKQ